MNQFRFPLLALGLGRHNPARRRAEWPVRHRDLHAKRLERYEHAPPGQDPYRAATLDFGIRDEWAVRDWFDAQPPELTSTRSRLHD